MIKYAITLFITAFIVLIVYGFMAQPFAIIIDELRYQGNETIGNATILAQHDSIMGFIPNLLGILCVILFIGSGILFYASITKEQREKYRYR